MYSPIIVLIFLSLYTATLAHLTSDIRSNRQHQHIINTRSSAQKYCGRNIVNVLRLLCDGNYFSPVKRNTNKRGQQYRHNPIGELHTWDHITPKQEYYREKIHSNDFISPKQAFNMLSAKSEEIFNRNRRGIVEECCKKPCTVRELYTYCD